MEAESFKPLCKQVKSITKTGGNLFKDIKQPWLRMVAFCLCSFSSVIIIHSGREANSNCSFSRGLNKTRTWSSVDKTRTMRRTVLGLISGNVNISFSIDDHKLQTMEDLDVDICYFVMDICWKLYEISYCLFWRNLDNLKCKTRLYYSSICAYFNK